MKRKPPKEVIAELEKRGYKVETWMEADDGKWFAGYGRGPGGDVLCTVGLGTGSTLVEVLRPIRRVLLPL